MTTEYQSFWYVPAGLRITGTGRNILSTDKKRNRKKGVVRDIHEIMIDTSLLKRERILDFLNQIENPLEYEDNGVRVVLEFSDTEETLTDRLVAYANCMRMNH